MQSASDERAAAIDPLRDFDQLFSSLSRSREEGSSQGSCCCMRASTGFASRAPPSANGWAAVFIRCHGSAMPRAVGDDTCARSSLPPPEFRSAGLLSLRAVLPATLRHRCDNNSMVGSRESREKSRLYLYPRQLNTLAVSKAALARNYVRAFALLRSVRFSEPLASCFGIPLKWEVSRIDAGGCGGG